MQPSTRSDRRSSSRWPSHPIPTFRSSPPIQPPVPACGQTPPSDAIVRMKIANLLLDLALLRGAVANFSYGKPDPAAASCGWGKLSGNQCLCMNTHDGTINPGNTTSCCARNQGEPTHSHSNTTVCSIYLSLIDDFRACCDNLQGRGVVTGVCRVVPGTLPSCTWCPRLGRLRRAFGI